MLCGLLVVQLACGCASPPLQEGAAGSDELGTVPLPPDAERLVSPDGGYWIELRAPAFAFDEATLAARDAEIGVVYPAAGVALMTFLHSDSRKTIDDLVYAKKGQMRGLGTHEFRSEERFFLDSGHYRAASLSVFVARPGVDTALVLSLICDSPRGKIEIHAWSLQEEGLEFLRDAVLALRMEDE